MNITEFLLARISEDEAVAREVISERETVYLRPVAEPHEVGAILDGGWIAVGLGAERFLAECAAKREIIALHREMFGHCRGCADETFPCRTLAALAQVYADHPDFDPTCM